MSHKGVETIIGKLVTDEGFRQRFFAEPATALDELRQRGCEVTALETEALLAIDPEALEAFAAAIDARLQKLDIRPA
jgi:Ribosomally synthesized peptide prototyped by Frankia Franean1_4349.